MAQTGFTPIQIYRSSTASAAPTSGNLVAGELAINTADGKLFYLDNLNAVQVIGWKLVPVSAGGTGTTTSTGTGSVVLSNSPTFTTAITSTGALQLTGSATVAQNIATSQTSGSLTVGGASATGAITIGQSTGTQSITIGSDLVNTVSSGATRTINIGTTAAGTGVSNVTIGRSSATVNHTTNVRGRYVTISATTTLSLVTGSALVIGQNLAQTTTLVDDLANLTGVVTGSRAFVTDALAPIFGSVVVSGGAVAVPVYYDGTDWICDAGLGTLSGAIVGTTDTQTLTNKRITSRVVTTTSSATPTINTDNTDQFGLTAQAVDITSFTTNLSGTPTDGQKLWIYIVGTAARAITWGASFESSTATLPTTTVSTNRLDVGFVWNVATSKWRCVAVA